MNGYGTLEMFNNDLITHIETDSGTDAFVFGRKIGFKKLVFYIQVNTAAVIFYRDNDFVRTLFLALDILCRNSYR